MSSATEERFAVLLHETMADVRPDETFIRATLAAGRRRERRHRVGLASGALAVVAATTAGVAATNRAAAPDGHQVATEPGPSPASGPPRLPTPAELTQRLAAQLPGPSTPLSAGQVGGRIQAERHYDGTVVTARAYDVAEVTGRPFDPGQAETACAASLGSTGPTRCTVTDGGWAISVVARPDVAGTADLARAARVTFYRRDGLVVDLSVAAASVLPRAELVALATTGDWLPAS